MGFLDLFGFRRGGAENAVARPQNNGGGVNVGDVLDLSDPSVQEFLKSGGVTTASGAAVTAQTSLRVATAYRCVNVIASAISTLPMDLKRRVDDKTRVDATDHPLWQVLRRKPNSWQTPSEFKKLLQTCVLLKGNGYALIVRSRGRVTSLIPMDPDRVVVEQMNDLSLRYIYTRKDGGQLVLSQKDVFHLRGMTMDGVRGLSIISYAKEALGLSLQTEKHANTMFANGTTLGGILEHPKSMSDQAVAHLKESLESYRGAENAFKTLILEEGVKFTSPQMKQTDAQFVETRELNQLEIAMFFGVPPHMLGLTSKSTSWGAGIEQQSLGFVAYTLQDWMTMWGETIERDLIDDPELYARINPAGLIRGDIKTRYYAYSIGRQWGWLSANDIREKEDMDPVEGGNQYLTPLNMVPVGEVNNLPPEDTDADDPPAE